MELLWAAFAAVNYAAMIAWPSWETIPFHFVWISLTLLYGFRVWDLRPTLIVLGCVMALTGVSIGLDAFHGIQLWGELFEVPLMAAMFLAMVWHARRRVEAQRIAEGRAEEHRLLLESQERFIHDASHELRTPVTIARGHLELLLSESGAPLEVEVALDELGRMDAIVARLLVLAVADEPDFVQLAEIELEPLLEDVFMRWSELAPRLWRLGPLAPGRLAGGRRPAARRTGRAAGERGQVLVAGSGDRAARAGSVSGARCSSRWRTRGAACRRRHSRGSSSGSRGPTRRAPAQAGGVGLGLAITDAIAKAHGGGCTVASTAAGSIFALRLPGFTPALQRMRARTGAPAP